MDQLPRWRTDKAPSMPEKPPPSLPFPLFFFFPFLPSLNSASPQPMVGTLPRKKKISTQRPGKRCTPSIFFFPFFLSFFVPPCCFRRRPRFYMRRTTKDLASHDPIPPFSPFPPPFSPPLSVISYDAGCFPTEDDQAHLGKPGSASPFSFFPFPPPVISSPLESPRER